jgi:hypothetical protein
MSDPVLINRGRDGWSSTLVPKEQLKSLKITGKVEIEEFVRILNFQPGRRRSFRTRQAREPFGGLCSWLSVVKKFRPPFDDDDDSSSHSSGFELPVHPPREEIVIMCPTISGHSLRSLSTMTARL